MLSFFKKKDAWGNGLSVWVLALLLFALPFLFSVLKTVEMDNEVEAWLPARDPQAVLLQWYNENFPVKDRLFMSWDGSGLDDPRAELLAAKLEGYVDEKGVARRGSPYIEEVLTPLEFVEQMILLNIDQQDAIDGLTGIFVGEGALKVRLSDAGRARQKQIEQQIVDRLKTELDLDAVVLPPVSSWEAPPEFESVAYIKQREIGLEDEELEEVEESDLEFTPAPPHDFQLGWHLIKTGSDLTAQVKEIVTQVGKTNSENPFVEDAFFHAGSPISLLVTLNEAGEADRKTALEDIDRIADECFIPAGTVHTAGRPVGSSMLNQEVEKAAFNPDAPWYLRSVIGLSTIVSFALSFLMVRSFRLGLLVLTISLYATLLTMTLIPLTGRTMNMVLVVMPTLLSVLTLSGAIHLASYWKHAAQKDPKNAIMNAVRMAAQPCFLASATTAIGLASLMTSTLNPVRDFGIFAAAGCGISLVCVLLVLPSLMQLWPGKAPEEHESDGRAWVGLADFLIRNSTVVVILCMGMFAFGLYGLRYFKTETKVVRYFPSDARIITDYWFLEDYVVGINTVDTIVRFDQEAQENLMFLERMEIVRSVADKIREHGEITGAISLANFQKPVEKPAEDARFFEKIGYNKRSNELEQRMREGNIEAGNSLYTISQTDSDWKEPGDKALSGVGDELWRVSAQAYVMADNDYGLLMDELDAISDSVLSAHPGTSHSVTGMVPVFLRTQEALLESLIWSFGMAFGIIAVVLIVVLKNPIAGLITMLPNLMPVAFCFGTLSMLGISVDIGTMITASVALGIAVDGTLHLLTWFKAGIRSGKTREESIELALSHCAPAMWQTSAIVAIGLLMLAPASLLMISRFGILMAALIGSALIADIVFLPALLTGALGYVIERTERKNIRKDTDESTGSQSNEKNDAADEIVEHSTLEPSETNGSDSSSSSSSISGPHHSAKSGSRQSEIEAR